MLKRVTLIGALTALIAVLHSSDTNARYLLPGSGWAIFHGSTNCAITVSGARDSKKAGITCQFTITSLESACRNPQDMDTRPGKSFSGPPKKIQGTSLLVTEDGGFGKKGKKNTASGQVSLDELQFFTSAELCPNANWILVDVLPTVLSYRNEIFECVDAGCTVQQIADLAEGNCTLPPGFGLFNNNPPPPGTLYNCVETSHQHFN